MIEKGLVRELERVMGPQYVLSRKRDLLAYGYEAVFDPTPELHLPDVVVLPHSTQEVSGVMKAAQRWGVAVVPRGAGTGLAGGALPTRGGIILESSRMNRILKIDVANRIAIVEAGVVNLELQKALEPLGYFFAADPASHKVSTLGGNAASNAGGPHCLKYGVTTNHVLGLEVVLPTGEVIAVGGEVEDPPGYDLTGLLVGSEGTFAAITKLVLRLLPLAEDRNTFLAIFDSVEAAGEAVSAIIAAGIIAAALEFMDNTVVRVVEEALHAGYPEDAAAVLVIEIDGLKEDLEAQAERVWRICQDKKVRGIRRAELARDREALWMGRRGAYGAIARRSPASLAQDGTVPRTQLPAILRKVKEVEKEYGLKVGCFAHAGDGNLHPRFLFDAEKPGEWQRVRAATGEILEACVRLGGTISGEHGIGLEKLEYMPLQFTPSDLKTMRRIKQVFDPRDLLNPDKVIPKEYC